MMNNFLLKVASLGLAWVSFTISLFLCGQIVGFDQGSEWAHRPGREVRMTISISGSLGPSAYDLFVSAYIVIAICFCIYMVAKLYEKSTLSRAVSVVPLVVIIYKYWQLFQWKDLYLELNDDFGYYYWIINSIPSDWFVITTAATLLISQIVILFVSCRSSAGYKSLSTIVP